MSDEELLERMRETVNRERLAHVEVLKLLKEVDRRRLYAARGYRSLFDFCVRELKYSESSAWRRISSMRLINDIPEVEDRIVTGALSLSKATTLQNFFQNKTKHAQKTYTLAQKRELLQAVEGKPARETEQILASVSPIKPPQERERVLSPSEIEIRFVADQPLVEKLERLKDINSHRDPSRSYQRLFHWLTEIGLKQADPLLKSGPRRPATLRSDDPGRYVPVQIRHRVWIRDQGKCSFVDPKTGRRCESTRQLEIDHIQPYGLGGRTTEENLRLYCATHNQYAARKTYGDPKIELSAKRGSQSPAASDPAIA